MTKPSNRFVPDGPPTAQGISDLPEALTREQAAWLLQLTPSRLDAAYKRGEVPARQFGRDRIYSKSALLELVIGQ